MGVRVLGSAKFPKYKQLGFILRDMERGFEKIGKAVKDDFERTVKTWENKPTFTIEQIENGVIIGTEDDLYALVNRGAPPHVIPKGGGSGFPLHFQRDYKAKTRPFYLGSFQGGHSGPWVSYMEVQHPGFEPRHFDTQIVLKWAKKVTPILQVNFYNALKNWPDGYTTVSVG